MFPFTPIVMPQDRDKRFLYAIRRLKKRQQYTQLSPPSAVNEAPSTGGSSVSGPDVSVDNAVVRWNGTDSDTIQTSGIYILDTGRIGNKVTPAKVLDMVSQGAGDGLRLRNLADTQDRLLVYTVGGGNGAVRVQLRDGSGNLKIELLSSGESYVAGGAFSIRGNNELRFYDNGNYVGFEAPALTGDQIWVLPIIDGAAKEVLMTDGAGTLTFGKGSLKPRKMLNLDMPAANAQSFLAFRTWQDETVAVFAAKPGATRTVTVSTLPEVFGTMTGTVTINGKDAAGETIQEVVTINDAVPTEHETDLAFSGLTSVVADQTDGTTLSTYAVGMGDGIGVLFYPLDAASDLYKVTLNGAHLDPANYTVSATYGTMTPDAAIIGGDDFAISYKA